MADVGIDLGEVTYALYRQALSRAKRRLEAGNHSGASAAYREAATHLKKYAAYAASDSVRQKRLTHAQRLAAYSQQLVEKREPKSAVGELPGEQEQTDEYESGISGLIYRSPVTWNDVGGLKETKREIKRAYGLSVADRPDGLQLQGWRNILLYGPPGTGKTLLAAAASNGLDATFFNVKASDLLSKYFGESAKLISGLYGLARKRAPSVVFLDEMESLSRQRSSSQHGAEQRIISTFLAELGGLRTSDDAYVLTIGATNLPWLLDRAILSRFQRRIYVPLPDRAAREAILRVHIEDAGYTSEVALASLADQTDGYTGREIKRICERAAHSMIEKENPLLLQKVDDGRDSLQNYRLKIRPLSRDDFTRALQEVQPEVNGKEVARFAKWREQAF